MNSALTRLTASEGTGMGKLFKAMAVSDPKIGELPGFEKEHPAGAVRPVAYSVAPSRDNAMLHAASLASLPGIRHGFFTRRAAFRVEFYQSLNGGVGSRDAAAMSPRTAH